jgi:hypothetical protein
LIEIVAALGGILTAFGQISTVFLAVFSYSDKTVRDIVKVRLGEHPNKHHSIG